jgi:hypothetical protein
MDPTVIAAWIAAGVSVLTFVGTLAAQYLGYRANSRDTEQAAEEQRKQLDRTLSEQRAQFDRTLAEQNQQLDRTLGEQRARTLNERFATAAEQIGSGKPAVRLAGIYAMAGLADDWNENRQTCIDVLCAYLRMPYEPEPSPDSSALQRLAYQANREVRHTVIRVITEHLKAGAAVSWEGLNFDFTGVVFDGGGFRGARFSGGWVTSLTPSSQPAWLTSLVPVSPAVQSTSSAPSSLAAPLTSIMSGSPAAGSASAVSGSQAARSPSAARTSQAARSISVMPSSLALRSTFAGLASLAAGSVSGGPGFMAARSASAVPRSPEARPATVPSSPAARSISGTLSSLAAW